MLNTHENIVAFAYKNRNSIVLCQEWSYLLRFFENFDFRAPPYLWLNLKVDVFQQVRKSFAVLCLFLSLDFGASCSQLDS